MKAKQQSYLLRTENEKNLDNIFATNLKNTARKNID